MASYSLGRIEFEDKNSEDRRTALEKSDAVARFNDRCAECAYCGTLHTFPPNQPYDLQRVMDRLRTVHGGISIGRSGELSSPGATITHALCSTAPPHDAFHASAAFVAKYATNILNGGGSRKAAASVLIDIAAKVSV